MKRQNKDDDAKESRPLKAVDFFCGAGGMSYGLKMAGIQVLGGIDNSGDCKRTYEANLRGAKYIKHDISTLSAPSLTRRLGIAPFDDTLVFAGCSPCQFWSKIRTNKKKSQQSALLLNSFRKFINYFRPGYVIVENVPGLLTSPTSTLLPEFKVFLEGLNYAFDDGVINSHDYGVPQSRKRYLLVASRVQRRMTLPVPFTGSGKTVRDHIGCANGFKVISAGHFDPSDFRHTAAGLSPQNLLRISATPKSGGNRSAWKDRDDLQIPAYKGRDEIFRDVYARMYWDRPAPTITTRFNSLSNGRFGHPDEDRAISIREGATLQTFPQTFVFSGISQMSICRQIGNAVPPELARRIGAHIIEASDHG